MTNKPAAKWDTLTKVILPGFSFLLLVDGKGLNCFIVLCKIILPLKVIAKRISWSPEWV